MSRRKFFGKLLSWAIAVAALGFFYAGEALAVCCKSNTTGACGCSLSTLCASGTTKVTSCTVSGGSLSFRGSVISCTYGQTQGTVSAEPGNAFSNPPIPAQWTEHAGLVRCDEFPDNDNNGAPDNTLPNDPGWFQLSVSYTMEGACVEDDNSGIGNNCDKLDAQHKKFFGNSGNVSHAVCNNDTGELRYEAFCGPGVTVAGFLTFVPTTDEPNPPVWAADGTGPLYQLKLGGFRSDRKGVPDPTACAFDFPDQTSAGGLPARGVLLYKEFYKPGSFCTGQILSAGPGQRRMCHNNSFDPNSTNGPCAPEKVGAELATFTGGVNANDASTHAELLDTDQWRPDSTQNLGCKVDDPNLNSGNTPTLILDSATFDTATINAPGSVFAFVKGFPDDVSPAQRVNDVTEGLGIEFDGCRGENQDGLSQVICRALQIIPNDGFIELGIKGTTTVNGNTFEFIGFTSKVKLSGSCTPGTF